MKMSVSKTDLKNLAEEKELTYTVNIVASLTLKWKDIFDEVQEYLMGEHGSPTMEDPHRDLDGNLVFTDCDGDKFGLDELIEMHLGLFEDGSIKEVMVWDDFFYELKTLMVSVNEVSLKVSPKDKS
jgi:hypothetical protein